MSPRLKSLEKNRTRDLNGKPVTGHGKILDHGINNETRARQRTGLRRHACSQRTRAIDRGNAAR
jgi:hypothetical protein